MTARLWLVLGLLPVSTLTGCESPLAPSPAASPTPSEPVARVEQASGDVAVRRHDDLVWRPAPEKTDLGNYDSVRTGPGSTSLLRYGDSTVVDVAESSLVIVLERRLRKNVEETIVALPEGSIEGRLQDSNGRVAELTVRTRQGWVRVANKSLSGKAVFRTTVGKDGSLEVRSDRGELKILAEGKERVIAQNEALTLPAAPAAPDNDGFEELPAANWTQGQLKKVEPRALDDQGRPLPALSNLKGGDFDLFFLNEPRDRAVVKSAKTRVTGEVAGRLRAYLVTARGERELKPDSQGRFSLEVDLAPGENELRFKIVGPGEKDVRFESRKVVRP